MSTKKEKNSEHLEVRLIIGPFLGAVAGAMILGGFLELFLQEGNAILVGSVSGAVIGLWVCAKFSAWLDKTNQ